MSSIALARRLILFILLAFAAGCGGGIPRGQSTRPNVILIVIDTLRADRLGLMGNSDGLTPFLDSLSDQSVVFDRCFAPSPWTLPSMASVFTGVYAPNHGVEHGLVDDMERASQQQLSADHLTLTEQLAQAGYATSALVTNGHLMPEFGFSQGFEHYRLNPWVSAPWLVKEVADARGRLTAKEPFFLYLHFIDPHEPYLRHEWPDTPSLAGFSKDQLDELAQVELWDHQVNPGMNADSPVLSALRTLYDGEVRYTDLHVGQILSEIGIRDEDLIIITADHGEAFWEHASLGHSYSVYNEEIHIPLIIRFPEDLFAGTRVKEPVSLVDLMPTILGMAGASPQGTLDGIDLREALMAGFLPQRKLFADLNRPTDSISAVLDSEWKFIQDFERDRVELYDLKADWNEESSVLDDHAPLGLDYGGRIQAHRNREPLFPAPVVSASSVSEEDLEKFRALGYLR